MAQCALVEMRETPCGSLQMAVRKDKQSCGVRTGCQQTGRRSIRYLFAAACPETSW
jgi:hypothetical protein